ncbi:MAG: ABC transporter substrate-binding protein [Bryobacteraceae bacterium]|nr:ABC transporter substrate-binding protein [Bryobacteraceae bacterium]
MALLLVLGGCGGSGTGSGGRLVYLQRGEPRTFNPMFVLDDASHEVVWRMHADLIHINRETQQVEPALAESWTALPGGDGFLLKLRRDVRFSDGQPFDADDVLFTFQAHLDERVNSPQRESLLVQGKPIRVRKIDRYTVEFDLGGPYGPAERIFDTIAILPRHLLERAYKSGQLPAQWGLQTPPRTMAGLGPFRLKSYQPGEGLLLERNPYYWKKDSKGTALPYLNEILFRQVADEESQVLRFLGGEGDLLNRLSAKSFAVLEKNAGAHGLLLRDLGAGPEYNFLFFNLNPADSVPAAVAAKQAWFQDARFRKAISLAVDRDAMVKLVYGGRATALATHVTPGIRLWKNEAIPAPVRSLAEARKSLEAAGFRVGADRTLRDSRGQAVEFSILVSSSNQQRAQMAAMIQQDLKEIGIQAKVAPLESRTLLDRVLRSKNYDVCLFGLAFGDADPGSEMNVWPSSGPTHLWAPSQAKPGTGWEAEIDHLMRQQMATQGYAARKKLYDRVQEIEVEETPIVSLLSPNILVAARQRVGNFRPAVLDHYTLWNADELFLRPGPGDKK